MSGNLTYLIAFMLGASFSVLFLEISMRKKWPLIGIFITLLLLFGASYGIFIGDFYMAVVNLYLASLFVPDFYKRVRGIKCFLVIVFGSLILIVLDGTFIKIVALIGIVGCLLEWYSWRNTEPTEDSR